MKRRALFFSAAQAAGLTLISRRSLPGQSAPGLRKVPVGGVAAHLSGQLNRYDDEFEMVGYFAFAEGLGDVLFAGQPSERTARVSFRTDRFRLVLTPNGNAFQVSRAPTADGVPPAVYVYFNLSPDRDYARPESFSDGLRVAVFRPRSTQGLLVPGAMFNLVGTVNVETTSVFSVENLAVSLGGLADAATVSFVGVPPSLDEMMQNTSFVIPFSAVVTSAANAS